MKRIEEIDERMKVITKLEDPDIEWYDVREEPFAIHGLYRPKAQGCFRRMPQEIADATNEGVANLNLHTAGGRVRFVTDSPWVAIRAEMEARSPMPHMAFTGIMGFDIYARVDGKEAFQGTYFPPVNMSMPGFESKQTLLVGGTREVTINFPLYNRVDRLYVGVKEGSFVGAPGAYKFPVPVLYYGSSITQGGCASRPGNSYQAIITRMLDCDHINLGFSGSARGEQVIVDYMKKLDMSVFVCDYDNNAPSIEHLRKTHGPLYDSFREARPDLPIVLVTRPNITDEGSEERRDIIYETYQRALAQGDKLVSFIDGATLFDGPMRDSCTVDRAHPNDLGFLRMAQVIGAHVERWLKR